MLTVCFPPAIEIVPWAVTEKVVAPTDPLAVCSLPWNGTSNVEGMEADNVSNEHEQNISTAPREMSKLEESIQLTLWLPKAKEKFHCNGYDPGLKELGTVKLPDRFPDKSVVRPVSVFLTKRVK